MTDPTFDCAGWPRVVLAPPPPSEPKKRRRFYTAWLEQARRAAAQPAPGEPTEVVTQPRALVVGHPQRALPAGPVAGSVGDAILELLGSEGPLAAKAIADHLSRPFPSVRDALRRLRELGLVEGGGWRNPWRLK